jgi:uncharacterized protein YndB with AHSA1/START domain
MLRHPSAHRLSLTVTFKAPPQKVYDTLIDSKKHQSLSGEPAKISKKVGGKFTAWGSHLSGINLVLAQLSLRSPLPGTSPI